MAEKNEQADPFELLPLPPVNNLELAQYLVSIGWIENIEEAYDPLAPKQEQLKISNDGVGIDVLPLPGESV